MALEAHGGELSIRHGDTARILPAVEFRPDAEARPAVRGSDEAHNGRQVNERGAAPVHRDMRKQAMLDLVPLARARREMTDRDGEPAPNGQKISGREGRT